MAVYDEKIEAVNVLKGPLPNSSASVEKLIFGGKFKSKEFCLVSLVTPSRPKNIFFFAILFYEPLLTETPLFDKNEQRHSFSFPRFVHPFKSAFPQRHLFYFPKVIIVQMSKPVFWLANKLVSIFFKLVFQPYIRGQPPSRFAPSALQVIQPRPTYSAVKFKEFFVSYLFSFKLPSSPRTDLTFRHQLSRFYLSLYREPGLTITEDTAELLGEFCVSETRLQRLIELFHCLILERQTYIVHPKPGALYVLLTTFLFP